MSLAIAGPATALLAGSDVASHQHPGSLAINWARVKAAGHRFAIVKATEGISYVNPHYREDSDSMREAGLIRGTYHYALPQYSAVLQAQHYAAVLATNTTDLDLPPVLDLEETGGLGPVALQAWVRTFLATLDTLTGRQTIIYVSPGFWRYQMANTTEFSERPLWIADYNGSTEPTQPLPGGWRNWNIWQYSSWGQVPGVNTAVDLDKFNGGYVSLAAFSLRQKTVPTVPTIAVRGKWQVDPDYLKKALRQAKTGRPAAPLYKAPTGVDPVKLYQTTVQRGPAAPRN